MESNQLLSDEMGSHEFYMVKCVVIGDTGVGKTRLICSHACDTKYNLSQLLQTHVPTVWAIDQYRKNSQALRRSWFIVDGVTVSLRVWDTFGDHSKDKRFAYGRADVILLCFSIVEPRSLRNVINHWYPEIQKNCPGVPIILCGCQVDLRYLYKDPEFIKLEKGPFFREVKEKDILYPEDGRAVAKQIGASYYETSVFKEFGIETVFTNIARSALIYKRARHFWTALGMLKHIRRPSCQMPHLPPKPLPPESVITDAQIGHNFDSLLEREMFCDVIFMVQSVPIKAHKVCLVTASSIFEKIFLGKEISLGIDDESVNRRLQNSSDSIINQSISIKSCDLKNVNEIGSLSSNPSDDSLSSYLFNHPVFTHIELQPCPTSETLSYSSSSSSPSSSVYSSIVSCSSSSSSSSSQKTIITVDNGIAPAVFQVVLAYLYTGKCFPREDLMPEVRRAAELIGLTDLAEAALNILNHEEFLNLEILNRFYIQQSERLKNLMISRSLFSDVLFELDDGIVSAHRVLLSIRSDVMSNMFSYDFREKSAKLISFPGVLTETFCVLQEYLYTGSCPDFHSINCLRLIELANRLCQTELLQLTEQFMVNTLATSEKIGQDIAEEVLGLLEPAEMHNATYLYNWCLWYIEVNYDIIYKNHSKLLRNLNPEYQIYLTSNRWPPLWYQKEHDLYEKNLLDTQREKPNKSFFYGKGSVGSDGGCLVWLSGRKSEI